MAKKITYCDCDECRMMAGKPTTIEIETGVPALKARISELEQWIRDHVGSHATVLKPSEGGGERGDTGDPEP